MVINNDKEFEDFYPYKTKHITEYPKEYPCVCKWEEVDAGIMGDYRQVYVAYYPKNTSPNESFENGLFYRWIPIK